MLVHNYHFATGEYLGSSEADESPLEDGIFLIPAHATETEPPSEIPDDNAAVFADGTWSLVIDKRGETWWDENGTPVVVNFLGDPADEGLSDIEPEPEPAPERQPGILAQVRLRIEADVVESASTDGGISSSSVFEPGLLWCEFPIPIDGEYLVWPSNGATHRCYSLPEEQFPEGFAVRSQSYDGEDTFPSALQILVTKS